MPNVSYRYVIYKIYLKSRSILTKVFMLESSQPLQEVCNLELFRVTISVLCVCSG